MRFRLRREDWKARNVMEWILVYPCLDMLADSLHGYNSFFSIVYREEGIKKIRNPIFENFVRW